MAFAPAHARKFYLTDYQTARLGGPVAASVMKLQVEAKMSPQEIMKSLNMSEQDFNAITLTTYYRRQLSAQLKLREHDEQFKKRGTIDPRKLNMSAPVPAEGDKIPPAIKNFKLPKGVSPSDYAVQRIGNMAPAAVEKLVYLMENSRNETVQYNAAVKLLGLNGIVEIEKSISVIADAEAIIRELNRQGNQPKLPSPGVVDAEYTEVIDDSSADARGSTPDNPTLDRDESEGGTGEPVAEASGSDQVDSEQHEAVARGPVGDGEGRSDLYFRPGRSPEPSQEVPGESVA